MTKTILLFIFMVAAGVLKYFSRTLITRHLTKVFSANPWGSFACSFAVNTMWILNFLHDVGILILGALLQDVFWKSSSIAVTFEIKATIVIICILAAFFISRAETVIEMRDAKRALKKDADEKTRRIFGE